MKRIIAFLIAFTIIFGLCSCTDEKEANAEIIAAYSVNSTEDDFIVVVQDLGGVYSELYDSEGIHIKFKGGKENIVDEEGNALTADDLEPGDMLRVSYNGTLAKKNPKTIKAVKVTKIA